MPRYINPVPQYHDSQGNILVEGFLLFEESGTNTKKDIYHDVDLTIAATNPVKLDGAGRTPSLFTEGLYKVTAYKDDGLGAPGEQQWSRDPVGDDADGFGSVWGQTSTYALEDVVQGSDGEYYISIISANKGNDPTTTPSAWSRINLIVDWNTNETYAQFDVAKGSDGSLYYSVIGSNVGNDPVGDGGVNWKNTGQSAIDAAVGVTVQAWDKELDSLSSSLEGIGISGLETSNGADADHDIDVSVGRVPDSTKTTFLVGTAQTKQIDATWATGTNAGGLASALTLTADTWYHFFITDDGSSGTEYGWDTSITAANLLSDTGGTKFAYLQSHLTDPSSNITPYVEYGGRVSLVPPTRDVAASNPGTSAVTATLTVPPGVSVVADIETRLTDASATGVTVLLVSSLLGADIAPNTTNTTIITTASTDSSEGQANVITNTSSQVRYRLNASDADISVTLVTRGWVIDRREI